jgi:HEAT repeat protein
LATALSDGQPNVRASVVTSLGMLKDRRAVPLLIGALQRDDNSYVRWHAARALGELGDARAVGPLQVIEADENEDEIVRSQARTALEKFNNAVRSGQL